MTTGAYGPRDVQKRIGKPPDPCLMAAMQAVMPHGCSVIDLGAGTGRYVRALRELSYDALGVDGGEGVEQASGGLVLHADLTADTLPRYCSYREWAICIEVGEHVPEALLRQFLNAICSAEVRHYLVSWALPGQRGRNHVSCHTPEWVACEFGRRGWRVHEEMTATARKASEQSGFAKKLLIFY